MVVSPSSVATVNTPNTLTSREQLLEELQCVRSKGVAYDREEHTQGICAVGAAIPYMRDSMVAITIVLPSIRFYGAEQRLAAALLTVCQRIKEQ